MKRPIKPSRPYDSSRRQDQARQTRQAVLAAARQLFLSHGYAATGIASVASEAGVSVETIYKTFGNKAGLVKAVFDVAVVGDDEPIPMLQREFVRRNMAEPDPREKLVAYGDHLSELAPRICPIQLVVRDAAITDLGAAQVWEQLQAERLTGMTAFARHLQEGGHLRTDVSANEARDALWLHNSPELWSLLVAQRRWTNRRYGRWVAHQLIAALL
jgi:AcrR family transcriptional regulator